MLKLSYVFIISLTSFRFGCSSTNSCIVSISCRRLRPCSCVSSGTFECTRSNLGFFCSLKFCRLGYELLQFSMALLKLLKIFCTFVKCSLKFIKPVKTFTVCAHYLLLQVLYIHIKSNIIGKVLNSFAAFLSRFQLGLYSINENKLMPAVQYNNLQTLTR